MKRLTYLFSLFFVLTLTGCEEEITLDFDKTVPRLVIEANIFVDEPAYNKVHLSTTTDFYSNVFPAIDDAEVRITDLADQTVYTFQNIQNGDFINPSFNPQTGGLYELTVVYKNQTYKAQSTLMTAPEITDITQKDDGGITGDTYEIKFFFQDDADKEDYYLVEMTSPADHYFGTLNDQFTNGNLTDDLYFYDKEDIKPGDKLQYAITSISKEYYNYLSKLLSISGESSNPFASPMGTIKGNLVNQDDKENYALGYFHIAKRNQYTYTVK